MRWLNFIFSHSLFIAACAVALCFQTDLLLAHPYSWPVYAFVGSSTLCSYNFYWLISKYKFSKTRHLPSFIKGVPTFVVIFILAGIGMAWSFFHVWFLWPYILSGVFLTLFYSLPLWPFAFAKVTVRAGFLKPILLAATWAFITVMLPGIYQHNGIGYPLLHVLVSRFLFMLMLCIIFDMRDGRMDKVHGLHSLATDVSPRWVRFMFACVAIAYGLMALLPTFPGTAWQRTGLEIALLLVCILYFLSFRKRGYLFYYFLVDGMMIASPLLAWLMGQVD